VALRNHAISLSGFSSCRWSWCRHPQAWAGQRGQAKEQVEFGIQVAQRGLWKEAIYRWERAAQIDPTYAAAFNNLAVAYEHEGQLAKARAAYEKALALEPTMRSSGRITTCSRKSMTARLKKTA
jgi:Tfp pilus assembly protein PilF